MTALMLLLLVLVYAGGVAYCTSNRDHYVPAVTALAAASAATDPVTADSHVFNATLRIDVGFNASGDGVADDANAFEAAFAAAVEFLQTGASDGIPRQATILLPANRTFLINRTLDIVGPFGPDPNQTNGTTVAANAELPAGTQLTVQLDGTILLPYRVVSTVFDAALITLRSFNNLVIRGMGEVNGQGQASWKAVGSRQIVSGNRPHMFRVQDSANVWIENILLRNAPMHHLNLRRVVNATLLRVKTRAPFDSPNTMSFVLDATRNAVIEECETHAGCW